MHWLADVSLPIDISWTNAAGVELSGDDVTSDEDSVYDDDEDEAGMTTPAAAAAATTPVAHGTPGLMAELSQQQQLQFAPSAVREKGGEKSVRLPPSSKQLQNPGSRVWRAEIEVSDGLL